MELGFIARDISWAASHSCVSAVWFKASVRRSSEASQHDSFLLEWERSKPHPWKWQCTRALVSRVPKSSEWEGQITILYATLESKLSPGLWLAAEDMAGISPVARPSAILLALPCLQILIVKESFQLAVKDGLQLPARIVQQQDKRQWFEGRITCCFSDNISFWKGSLSGRFKPISTYFDNVEVFAQPMVVKAGSLQSPARDSIRGCTSAR